MNTTEQEPQCLVAICPSCKALHAVTYPHMIADPAQRACAVEEFNDARSGHLRISWMSRADAQALTPCQPGGCGCERKTDCPRCTLPSAMCACPDAPGWSEDGCMVVHCPDPIIAANIREMAGRSVVGIGKYQKMLTRTDLSPKEWFTHHRTELMDAMGYNRKLEGIYDDLQQTIKELTEDNSRKADRIAELETQRTETMVDYKRQAERIAFYEECENLVSEVYCHITGNRLSKINTSPQAVIDEAEQDYARCFRESGWADAEETAKKDDRIAELEAENGRLVALVDSLATRFPDVATNVTAWAKQQKLAPHYCPKCSQPLQRVRQSADSMLNAEQFAAIRSGDWFCDCGGPDTDGYRYFWQSELPAPPKGEGVAS